MSGSCKLEGCTIDETGICALERDPSVCSNRIAEEVDGSPSVDAQRGDEPRSQTGEQLGAPVLEQPASASAFPSSRPLGLEDLNSLMGTRYVHVVGILGDPESGKTALLASLYLLVSHAMLEGWSFADSRSLTAFEEIARGARDWNDGKAPEQMTVHTELSDDHRPGFLHLRLVRLSDNRRVDLALPDVPGEWTQALVNTARSDRLDFMKSAEVIWIVLDGRTLADIEKRQGLIARVGQLAGRLSTMLNGVSPRLMLVVTHRDMHVLSDNVANRLHAELARRGAKAEVVGVAPFSDDPDNVPPGFGISELINLTVTTPTERPTFWQLSEPIEGDRAYLSYRRDR
ncbi:TRAFAC clade GTPase domain-containing protein [Burkholderia glumae]|uniref:TRAFAC clade GTPase domain-containing protein n=1 Tax=Burkholderia glumae TaxID=337 RepID=UPI003B98FBEA